MLNESFDRIRNVLDAIRARLWLIPVVMSVVAAFIARVTVRKQDLPFLDQIDVWWYFAGDADTARDLLSTLLSGMISMTALVISITMVVLSLAAGQLGPRIIWNFIRDRQSQVAIGIFFATIVYILVVVSSVTSGHVPSAAITAATALVALCLFVLLFYIHKVARSIVADTVVNGVAAELGASIAHLPDANGESESADPDLPPLAQTTKVAFGESGYVQVIEYRKLAHIAGRARITVEIDTRSGHFVLAQGSHLVIRHDDPLTDETIDAVRSTFLIGSQRTPTQDLEYSVRQLVEIAVRALSPGVNDPFTAIVVVHRLGEALEDVMSKHLPDRVVIRDDEGTVRVVGLTSSFRGLVDTAFNQIRQAAARDGDVALLIAIAGVLGQLGAVAATPRQREALHDHLQMIARAADRAIEDESDRHDFASIHEGALRLMNSPR